MPPPYSDALLFAVAANFMLACEVCGCRAGGVWGFDVASSGELGLGASSLMMSEAFRVHILNVSHSTLRSTNEKGRARAYPGLKALTRFVSWLLILERTLLHHVLLLLALLHLATVRHSSLGLF